MSLGFFSSLYGQATNLPYIQDFELNNDLTFANGTQANKWSYGSATGNTGQSMYISNNNGVSNAYTINSTSYTHAYKDIVIPAGSTIAKFSFDWKAEGQTTVDFLRVWMIPTTYTPTAGTIIPTATGTQIAANLNRESTWQTFSNPTLDVSSFAGTTMRLVFEWRNNATSGTQTPAAIDNINLSIPSCLVPSALSANVVGATTASLGWIAPSVIPTNGYEYYVSTVNTPPTAATNGLPTNTISATANGLLPLTEYFWWIRSVCSTTDKSDWASGGDFKTTQIPATLPYLQNFSANNDFEFANGSTVNKWAYGGATGNTGNSIYISNDNGITNAYTLNTPATTVHAYRDITIPAGSTTASLTFDWKAEGQTTLDYLRVWVVPSTYIPSGTASILASSGGIQVGGNFNQENTWQTYDLPNLDISSFAGGTMRLVFEWRNNTSGGTQSPAAIDNINLNIPSCLVPTTPIVSNINGTTVTLGWDAPSTVPANGYEYYISTNNTAPTATTFGLPATTIIANATGLLPTTVYYWWVRSLCTGTTKSDWIPGPEFFTTQIPAILPYTQNFETSNDLELVNGTQVNKWSFGTATGNTGNSIYVSNDNGVTNAYTITSLSNVYAYRDIEIPTGSTTATLSFDWKANGQTTLDFLKIWMVPVTYNPTAGTAITAGSGRIQVGGVFSQNDFWETYQNTTLNISSFAGNRMRLIFEWKNNTSVGAQSPAAVDNINLFIPSCFAPTNLTTNTITTTTSNLAWTATTPNPALGYEYYVSTNNVAPTATTLGVSVASNIANLTNLLPNTVYYWWVRSVCTNTDKSIWVSGPDFNTEQIPATIPYVQDFTTNNDFTLFNANQVNKWAYGNATGNTASSLYISDDNGISNNYNIIATSTSHAYRDITIPAGATIGSLFFDWKGQGDSSLDYLRVWLAPITFKPTPGSTITSAGGKIQVGNNFNQADLWQNYNNTNVNISSFAGTTMRLIFEWKNNASSGTQTPAAVDNIKFLICSNATPTVTVANVTHNTTDLTWNQDIGGASYTIQYRPVGTQIWNTVQVNAAPFGTTTNTYTLTNLIPSTPYEVEIAAVCNNLPGTFSHSEFTTQCDPTPPNITLTNITTNAALITWSPLATNSTYLLRWREVGTTVWNEVFNLLPPLNTYQLNNLGSYKTYEVQVANMCNGSTTPNSWSTPQVFTTERICQIAPPGLTITNLTTTTAEVIWDSFPGSTYIFKYRKVGSPSWITISANINAYNLTALLENTQYEMQVANVCSGTAGDFTKLYLFTTPTVVYCPMSSADSSTEFISKVTANPTGKPQMINESLSTNYSDFTNDTTKIIELVQGTSNNQIIVNKTLSTDAKAGLAIWIDFNRNGYFDLDERIIADGPNSTTTSTATFSVPSDASVSISDSKYVVMRVALQKDGIPINCENFQAGEVEDYMVKISKQGVANLLNPTEIIIYPNPVSTTLFVKNISKKAQYKIYNAAGQIVSNGILLNNQISVANLSSGVYVIDIEDAKGNVQKKFIKE